LFAKLRLLTHACVLAGLLGASVTVRAQSEPARKVRLQWERLAGAEACIDSTELAQRVEAQLGHEVFSPASAALVIIDGQVAPALEHGFTATIHVRGPDGTLYGNREVSVPDPDCRKLDDVLALIISVTLRHEGVGGISLPDAIADQLAGLFEPEPAEPEPDKSPSAADSGPELIAQPRTPIWQARLEAGFGLSTGVTPFVSFAPLLRAQLELLQRFSLAFEGRLALTQTQRISSETRGSFEYRSNAFALIGCVSPLRAARLALAVCVDARVGYLSVQPQDFVYSYGASARWLELALAGSLRAALLGPTFAHLRASVPWRINRPRFKYQSSQGDLRDAFRIALVGLDLSLSLGVEF
jgi:hypothetical protein